MPMTPEITPGGGHSIARGDPTFHVALAQLKPRIAVYVGGMGHRDKNFHKDMMIRRGYGDAAARIQELYLAGRKEEATAAVPDEFCAEGRSWDRSAASASATGRGPNAASRGPP